MARVKYDSDQFSPKLIQQNTPHIFFGSRFWPISTNAPCISTGEFFTGNYKLPMKVRGQTNQTYRSTQIDQAISSLLQQQNISCKHLYNTPTFSTTTSIQHGNNKQGRQESLSPQQRQLSFQQQQDNSHSNNNYNQSISRWNFNNFSCTTSTMDLLLPSKFSNRQWLATCEQKPRHLVFCSESVCVALAFHESPFFFVAGTGQTCSHCRQQSSLAWRCRSSVK
eukprot:6203779-Pleurochrysis_carterae.AAC.5